MKIYKLLLLPCFFFSLNSFADQLPPKIYVDKNVCPYECCKYKAWKVIKDGKVFKAPDSKVEVGEIKKGETITALTGEVHSVPYEVTVTSSEEGDSSKVGDKIYLLTSLGEGTWHVWEKGKVTIGDSTLTDYDTRKEKTPMQSAWWIKIKLKNGSVGWVEEDGQFDGSDVYPCS